MMRVLLMSERAIIVGSENGDEGISNTWISSQQGVLAKGGVLGVFIRARRLTRCNKMS
jgi:hypothetical protein